MCVCVWECICWHWCLCAHTPCLCVYVYVYVCVRVHIHVVMVAEIFTLSKCNDMSGNQLQEYRNSNTPLFIIMDCCDDWRKLIHQDIFIFSQTCKLTLGTTQLPVCGYQVYFLWVKWVVCEVDRSPPSSIEVKNKLIYIALLPLCAFMVWTLTAWAFTYFIQYTWTKFPFYKK